jgi:protein-S-isoprenylcysteine O-methyltransferase Ste14
VSSSVHSGSIIGRQTQAVTLRGLSSAFGNVFLALLFALFAYGHAMSLLEFLRLSVLLILVKEVLDAVFYPYHWVIALTGTFCLLLLRPTQASHDLVVGQFLVCTGLVLQALGMLSLKRSIGMVPANRGIVTTGLYRVVRHPLYSSYVLTLIGYLISNFTLGNALVVLALWFPLTILRIVEEERFLSQDPGYVLFMERTRWRLIPYVF